MAEGSGIEWTDHTCNPWMGCTRVSEACRHCYAESLMDTRWGKVKWGPKGRRVVTKYWALNALKWNARAAGKRRRTRVFCASLADVFEGPDTMPAESWPVVCRVRAELFALIAVTPWLDWQILTKRPENIVDHLQLSLDDYADQGDAMLRQWLDGEPPHNVWLGTTVENQEEAERRIPELVKVPAVVRFLSCEPLLGPVDLIAAGAMTEAHVCMGDAAVCERACPDLYPAIDWVIAGGESGRNARPTHPDWVRALRDQCAAVDVPFFFKQWGEWLPCDQAGHLSDDDPYWSRPAQSIFENGHVQDPRDPSLLGAQGNEVDVGKIGKARAGRELDGQIHSAFPLVA